MANEWYRFGPQPATLGVASTPIYYLSFTDEMGISELTHTYDPDTGEWTAVNDGRVVLQTGASYFRLLIDGRVVMTVEDAKLTADSYTTDSIPLAVSASFIVQRGPSVERWATISHSGVFSTPQIEEANPDADASVFQFTIDAALTATITSAGLVAIELATAEYYLAWSASDADLIVFDGDDTSWLL
jgi:hypothetical protein